MYSKLESLENLCPSLSSESRALCGDLYHSTCKPTCAAVPGQIHIACFESHCPALCQAHFIFYDMKPFINSSRTQCDEAQRVSVIGTERRERLARAGDCGILVLKAAMRPVLLQVLISTVGLH